MGIYALAAKKLTAAVNGRLKAKPCNGAQRRSTAHNGTQRRRCAVVRRCVVSTDRRRSAQQSAQPSRLHLPHYDGPKTVVAH